MAWEKENTRIYPYQFASVLSIIACFWLFFKYLKQMNKGVKSLLIVILAASNMIYNTNHLLEDNWIGYRMFERRIHYFFDSFSMCFSIFWASAIAYVVYKNLADRYVDLKKLFTKVLFVVTTLSLTWTILFNWLGLLISFSYSRAFGALLISLLLAVVFYKKSLTILQVQSQYEQKSTSLYIKNLRYFSFVQLFTYGPMIVLNVLQESLKIGVASQYWVEISCTTLACLSGFLTVLVFACQGGLKANSGDGSGEDNDADLDLTSDILTSH